MQTFIPFPDTQQSAACLDRQRLGKQRVECLQLLNALTGESGWKHHPAVGMWRNYEGSLAGYGVTICDEWISRGYKDTCRYKILAVAKSLPISSFQTPDWWGLPELHLSHRSNLLRKFPEHYAQYFPDDPDDLPYIWPSPSL